MHYLILIKFAWFSTSKRVWAKKRVENQIMDIAENYRGVEVENKHWWRTQLHEYWDG